MQRPSAVGKHREGRRADGMLGNVKNLTFLEMQMFHKPVQLSRSDAPRGRFINLADQTEQLSNPGTGLGRQENDGRIIQEFELVPNTLLKLILLLRSMSFHLIPLVDADDHRAPTLVRVPAMVVSSATTPSVASSTSNTT